MVNGLMYAIFSQMIQKKKCGISYSFVNVYKGYIGVVCTILAIFCKLFKNKNLSNYNYNAGT